MAGQPFFFGQAEQISKPFRCCHSPRSFLLLLDLSLAVDVLVHGELLSRHQATEHREVSVGHLMRLAGRHKRWVLEVLPMRPVQSHSGVSNLELSDCRYRRQRMPAPTSLNAFRKKTTSLTRFDQQSVASMEDSPMHHAATLLGNLVSEGLGRGCLRLRLLSHNLLLNDQVLLLLLPEGSKASVKTSAQRCDIRMQHSKPSEIRNHFSQPSAPIPARERLRVNLRWCRILSTHLGRPQIPYKFNFNGSNGNPD